MVCKVYITILMYYVLGATGIYIINRNREKQVRRKAWIKVLFAFIFTNTVFFTIAFNTMFFSVLTILVIIAAFFELHKLYKESGYMYPGAFLSAILIMAFASAGLYFFSRMDKGLIIFSFLILSIFDGFSQITGQLFGRTRLFPQVSLNKTVEGLIGGTIIAVLSALVFRYVIPAGLINAILLAVMIALFSFAGDAAKSIYKRKYKVKDFSNLIPEHGGILDRFDSLIATGSGVALISLFMNL